MSSSTTLTTPSRTDTTVVGPIAQSELFFFCMLIPRNGVQDLAIATINDNSTSTIKQLNFVQSSTYIMLTNTWSNTNYSPLVFSGIKEASGSYMFFALNGLSASNILGPVTTSNNGFFSVNTTGSTASNYVLDPQSNANYPTDFALTSVPYRIFSVDGDIINMNIITNTGVDNSNSLGGLATGLGNSVTNNTSGLLFLPLSYFIRGNCSMSTMSGNSPTQIFASLANMQCIQSPNTNYKSNNTFCNPLVTGFTKQDECNQGGALYAYCNEQSPNCGSMVEYTDLNGNVVDSNSCRGWCREGTCLTTNTSNNISSCVRTQVNPTTVTSVPIWTWFIIGGLILLIIVMVVVTLFFALRTKSHRE